jgi:AI-2 transport protein TqsA
MVKKEISSSDIDEQLDSIYKLVSTMAFSLIAIIGIQYIAQDLIAPILLAVFLSILLRPVYQLFRRKGASKGLSLVLMLVTFIVVAGGIVFFLTWSFTLLRDSLGSYVNEFKQSLEQFAGQVGASTESVKDLTGSINPDAILKLVTGIIGSLGSVVVYLVIVPILAVLILLQIDSMPKNVSEMLRKENAGVDKYRKFAESIIIYVVGRFKVNFVTGLLFAAALILLGIPFPFVWGLLTMILSYIPYVGLVIAAIPPTLLAFAQGGIVWALIVVVAVVIINLIAENILEPYIQGKGNKLSTASIVIALIFWTWLLGPVGAILAAPLTVLMKIILTDYKETHWIALLMEGNYEQAKTEEGKSSMKNKLGSLIPRK